MKTRTYGIDINGKPITSQSELVLDWLRRRPGKRTITSKEAFDKWGITRLSAKVYDIEKKYGIVLKREDIKVVNRYGINCWVTKYWYAE